MHIWLVAVFGAAICINLVTRVLVHTQINRRVSPSERSAWWTSCDSDVRNKFGELFPGSPLATVEHLSFYACIALIAVFLVASIAIGSTN